MYYYSLIGANNIGEGGYIEANGISYIQKNKILRQQSLYSKNQTQTEETFRFKWGKRDTYESESVMAASKKWLIERYLNNNEDLVRNYCFEGANILDAGCGSGFSSLLLFGKELKNANYLGVDISEAVDVAHTRFGEEGIEAEFIQADIGNLPFTKPEFDVIFSEGVLHHTDSTEKSLKYLANLLNPGGFFLFYVYRKKSPVREFSDDFIREKLTGLSDDEAWDTLLPISRLGRELGELNISVTVPEDIPILGISSGTYDLQRFFYWYFLKAFYRPDFSLDEMNHINFDWYRPMNCHRHTEEEIQKWCFEAGLRIDRMKIEEAGITIVAQKRVEDST